MTAAATFAAFSISFVICRVLAAADWLHDTPNDRSTHTKATPRSGGVAIFSGWLFAMASLWVLCAVTDTPNQYLAFVGFGFLAFLIGFADDWRPLSAIGKLIGQITLAVAFTFYFGPAATAPAPLIGDMALGSLAFPLTVFWIVAFMNAYNFMDGINGLAASCGAFALAALAVAAAVAGNSSWSLPALILAAAIFGFLPSNLKSGRLFMGDGGSQSIGFLIAALAVLLSNGGDRAVSPLFVPTAFMPFLFDVAFTLIRRARLRRNLFAAHQEHLYQKLALAGRRHSSVTAIYLALTALSIAAAMAMTAAPPAYQFLAPIGLAVGFLPLALLIQRQTDQARRCAHDSSPHTDVAAQASISGVAE